MSQQIGRNEPASRMPVDRNALVKAPPPNPPKRRAKPAPIEQTTHRKQTGRRYGPPPKNPPHAGMQSPKPMDNERRRQIYRRGSDMTARQLATWWRKTMQDHAKSGLSRLNGKGRATPKRRSS